MSTPSPEFFWQNYKGPKGPHLAHRTFYTQTGKPAPADTQRSIHPRVVFGKTIHPKSNTCR